MELAEAIEALGASVVEAGLYDLGWYLSFSNGETTAKLDGDFSAEDLEAIAVYMRAHGPAALSHQPEA